MGDLADLFQEEAGDLCEFDRFFDGQPLFECFIEVEETFAGRCRRQRTQLILSQRFDLFVQTGTGFADFQRTDLFEVFVVAGKGDGLGVAVDGERREAAGTGSEQVGDTVKYDGLEINFTARDVYIDGVKANLTPKEYDLLFYLVKNKNIALTRNKLLEEVWGYDFFGDDRTIDTHIKMLRNNLGPYRNFIVTLRGMGYKFEA